MRFGVCAGIDQAAEARQAGYDFMEGSVLALQAEKSESEVKELLTRYEQSPLPFEAFNRFFPADLCVVGEKIDAERVKRYTAVALERVKRVGGQTVVFGSGQARNVPNGFSKERAHQQILEFLDMAADFAEPLGVMIVIEPLHSDACNTINSVAEAADVAKLLNRTSVQILADLYHMYYDAEPFEHIVTYRSHLRHIHLADRNRKALGLHEPLPDAFVARMKQAGYDGRVSFECRWEQFDQDIVIGMRHLKDKFRL